MGNEVTRAKYKQQGTCTWCPRPRHYSETRSRFLVLCTKHWQMERIAKKKSNALKKELGLCHQCGKPLGGTTTRHCEACKDKGYGALIYGITKRKKISPGRKAGISF